MSSPYPPPPKKLYRSRSKRMISGVCGGLADYLNMDPTLVRILTVVIALFTGIPIVLYIVAIFVVPEEPADFASQGYPPVNAPPQGYDTSYAAPAPGAPVGQPGYGQPSYGQPPAYQGADVWGSTGAPWEQPAANLSPEPAPSPDPAQPAPSAEPAPPSQPEPVAPAHEADAEESLAEPDHPADRDEDQPKS